MQAFCCCTSQQAKDFDEVVVVGSPHNNGAQQIEESPKAAISRSLVRTKTGRILGELPTGDSSEELSDDVSTDASEDSELMGDLEISDGYDDEAFRVNMAVLVKTKMLGLRWKEKAVSKLYSGRPSLLRASPSMSLECKEMPIPGERGKNAPMFEETLPGATVAQIRELLLLDSDACPLRIFLREVMDCSDLKISPWMLCNVAGGADVQRTWYKLPVKTEVPPAVTAVLGIPKFVTGCSLNCVLSTQGDVVLLQRSKVQGVKYADRFRVQNIHVFSPDGAGNVRWRMWVEVECIKPLPWTHSFLQKHITESTKTEAEITGPKFGVILRKALSDYSEVPVRAVRTAPA